MKIVCDCCKKKLTKPGGLLFTPPFDGMVRKYHLCVACANQVVRWIRGLVGMHERPLIEGLSVDEFLVEHRDAKKAAGKIKLRFKGVQPNGA